MQRALLMIALLVISLPAAAQIPATISYQGVLRDGEGLIVADDDYSLDFRIYSTLSGGAPLWEETQLLPTSGGIFDAIMGSQVPLTLPFDAPYWLGITVNGSGEMLPRVELTATPYALRAAVADSLAGETGLVLPWSGSINGEETAFSISNGGSGHAIMSYSDDGTAVEAGTSTGIGLMAYSEDEMGNAIEAYAVAGGSGAYIINSAGTSARICTEDYAIYGSTASGYAGYFDGPVYLTGLQLPTDATAGHVLTSDSEGNANWQPPGASGSDSDWIIDGNDMYAGVSGNVGIGMDAPNRKLYLLEDYEGLAFPLKLDNPHPTFGVDGVGILFSTGGSGGGPISPGRGKGGLVYEYASTWNRGNFHFLQHPGANSILPDLNDAVMTITNSGQVGIGSREPQSDLQVESGININTGDNFDNRVAPLAIGDADGTSGTILIDGNQIEQAYTGDDLHINYNSSSDLTLVRGGGSVGIGLSSPGARLDVNGTVAASGLRMTSSPTAGHVLTTDSSGNGSWQPPGAFTLPFSGSASSGSAALSITNGGTGDGGYFQASGAAAAGVEGEANYRGVRGKSWAADGIGVVGEDMNMSGTGKAGGAFTTMGASGRAVWGLATNTGNVENYGGYFEAAGSQARGVYGLASQSGNLTTYGGYFESRADMGRGVYGKATATGDIFNYGGRFEAQGNYGTGVYGQAISGSHGIGVEGYSIYGKGIKGTCLYGYAGYFEGMGYFSQRVGIGVLVPEEQLDVAGAIQCDVLKITGGSDLAEPFDVSDEMNVEQGMLLCIDSEKTGSLRLSSSEYDRCVAGVVSGAGGVSPGVIMGQRGTVADGEHPVAISGRVYCLADASDTPIRAGDLLTTSGRPGHAMRVSDYQRAQGAVIGKAMSSLDSGQGLVLVLVTLQ
jgi:hypothetical protein